ncbi:MAG: hypothetical protein GY951_01075 [Psychromonas sp.]|nr:hypothetical protein [Psychromonas sp.]
MDTILDFLKTASTLQLSILATAFIVWTMGGSFLKKRLLQRLNTESNERVDLEDVRFEDINLKEWKVFAALSVLFVGLVLVALILL